MKLEVYIKDCLKNPEFKKYWLEDNLPLIEESDIQIFTDTYKELSELFESDEEYKNKLDSLLIKKTEKLDKAEFKKAKQYRDEYSRR